MATPHAELSLLEAKNCGYIVDNGTHARCTVCNDRQNTGYFTEPTSTATT